MPTPKVVHQPHTYHAMQQGIHQIVAAIRPTLGPYPRRVINENFGKSELLDEGGVIARRIIQLGDRNQDVGAMFLRQVLWQLHEKTGDGTATAAVIFETVFNEGLRFIAAGGNATRLRHHLNEGLRLISDELAGMARPVAGKAALTQVAESVCYEPEMAAILGEILDIVGEHGQVDIRSGRGRGFEHDYVEGMYWKGGVLSRTMISDRERFVAQMEDAAIIISDVDVKEPRDLIAVMQMAMRADIKDLLLIVGSISETGLSVLLDKRIRDKVNTVAVKIDGFVSADLAAAQEDLAILTGGIPLVKAAGQSLTHVGVEHFGRARWVWADARNFGLAGGRGDPRRLRQHVAALRTAHRNATDQEYAGKLQTRLGKLLGGSATLQVGGITESDIKLRKAVAERSVRALRGALAEGVIPGGGMALLGCQPALEARLKNSQTAEERAAYHMLIKAMEAPVRTLLTNAGYEPSPILAKLAWAGSGHGFDILKGCVVNLDEAGILDVANVQKEAVHSAIASAALALTVDVMVQHRNPETSTEP